jgi:hypothetical protein
MTLRRALKYALLLCIGTFMLLNIVPMGDYGRGMASGILFIFLAGLLLLAYVITTISNAVGTYKKKYKFDFIPTLIIIFFVIITALQFTADGNKFWTTQILQASANNPKISGCTLVLYKDNSFAVTELHSDFSKTYQGNYHIKQDTLYLDRQDLTMVSDGMFAAQYFISKKDSTLYPVGKNFDNLKIR